MDVRSPPSLVAGFDTDLFADILITGCESILKDVDTDLFNHLYKSCLATAWQKASECKIVGLYSTTDRTAVHLVWEGNAELEFGLP